MLLKGKQFEWQANISQKTKNWVTCIPLKIRDEIGCYSCYEISDTFFVSHEWGRKDKILTQTFHNDGDYIFWNWLFQLYRLRNPWYSREILMGNISSGIRIYMYVYIIWFDVNTSIWLADSSGEKLVIQCILDNLGWYCDVTNIFIRQRQIQLALWNKCNLNPGIIKFWCKI